MKSRKRSELLMGIALLGLMLPVGSGLHGGDAERLFAGFREPGKQYSPVPLWWWDGDRLDEKRLTWQLEQLKTGGVHAVCFIQKYPLGPPMGPQAEYFSDAWWKFMRHAMAECDRLGMKLWVHDESYCRPKKGYWQNRLNDEVRRNRELQGHHLSLVQQTFEGPGKAKLTWPDDMTVQAVTAFPVVGKDRFHAEKAVDLGRSVDGSSVEWDAPDGRWQLVATGYRPGGRSWTTTAPLERFLDMHHRVYVRQCGESIRAWGGVFEDEMQLVRGHPLPWGPKMAEDFRRAKGYDAAPLLLGLYADIGPRTPKIRCDYYDVFVQELEDNWFRPLYEWLEQRGLQYSHDNWGRNSITGQTDEYVDYFRTMRWYQAPGYDDGGGAFSSRGGGVGRRNFFDAKLAASIAACNDRPRVWCEAFHTNGWGISTEILLAMIAENYCYGANLYDKHGLYYSTLGGWYEQAPPDTHFRQPYWRHAPTFNEAVTRLSYLFSQGKPVTEVALLYPVTSMQAGRGDKSMSGVLDYIDSATRALAHALYAAGLDLTFVDHQTLAKARAAGGTSSMAGMQFPVILLGPTTTVWRSTLAACRDLFDAGGVVAMYGRVPDSTGDVGRDDPWLQKTLTHMFGPDLPKPDAGKDAPLIHRGSGGGAGIFARDSSAALISAIKQNIRQDVIAPEGIYHAHRRTGLCDAFLLLNTSGSPVEAQIRLRSTGHTEFWDPFTGAARPAPAETVQDRYTALTIPFAPYEHRVVVVDRARRPTPGTVELAVKAIPLAGPWQFVPQAVLDNRWGDFRYPPSRAIIGPEIRSFGYRQERPGEDGTASGWMNRDVDADAWQEVRWSYGLQCWGTSDPAGRDTAPGDDGPSIWSPQVFSRQTGWPDGHPDDHGFNAVVNDAFLRSRKGKSPYFWTTVYSPQGGEAFCSYSPGIRQIWIDGKPVIETEGRNPAACLIRKGHTPVLVQLNRGAAGGFTIEQPQARALDLDMTHVPRMRWFHSDIALVWDARPWDEKRVGWYRFHLPVGAARFTLPVKGRARVWVDGREVEVIGGVVAVAPDPRRRLVSVRLEQEPGAYGGAGFSRPVEVTCTPVPVELKDWSELGLADFSGLGNYSRTIDLPRVSPNERIVLDLGQVHVSAAVCVNGQRVGTRVARPFQFDLTRAVKPGANTIEVEVANTVANHLKTEVPTRYVYPGQTASGLMGPLKLEIRASETH